MTQRNQYHKATPTELGVERHVYQIIYQRGYDSGRKYLNRLAPRATIPATPTATAWVGWTATLFLAASAFVFGLMLGRVS